MIKFYLIFILFQMDAVEPIPLQTERMPIYTQYKFDSKRACEAFGHIRLGELGQSLYEDGNNTSNLNKKYGFACIQL